LSVQEYLPLGERVRQYHECNRSPAYKNGSRARTLFSVLQARRAGTALAGAVRPRKPYEVYQGLEGRHRTAPVVNADNSVLCRPSGPHVSGGRHNRCLTAPARVMSALRACRNPLTPITVNYREMKCFQHSQWVGGAPFTPLTDMPRPPWARPNGESVSQLQPDFCSWNPYREAVALQSPGFVRRRWTYPGYTFRSTPLRRRRYTIRTAPRSAVSDLNTHQHRLPRSTVIHHSRPSQNISKHLFSCPCIFSPNLFSGFLII